MKYEIQDIIETSGQGSNNYRHYAEYVFEPFEAANDQEAIKIAEHFQAKCDSKLVEKLMAEGMTHQEALNTNEFQNAPSFVNALHKMVCEGDDYEEWEKVEF